MMRFPVLPYSNLLRSFATTSLWFFVSACSGSTKDSAAEESAGALLAKSDVLWPVQNEVASVRVCWAPSKLNSTYPVAALAPNVDARLAELKQWVFDVVEAEWNAKTPLKFTGFQDCEPNETAVELTPIDSATTASCGAQGQPCAVTLGKSLLRQRGVYLNLYFGEEVLYSSRYQQKNPGALYQPSKDVNGTLKLDYRYWLPQACFDEFRYAWSTNNSLTKHAVNIEDPQVLAQFTQVYEDCLKFNVLHEFGHIAGFAHEQQRKDVAPGCNAETNPDLQYKADTPLGPFDKQSIMSYCRTDPAPALSPEDIEQTKLVYHTSAGAGGTLGAGGTSTGGQPSVSAGANVGGAVDSGAGASTGGAFSGDAGAGSGGALDSDAGASMAGAFSAEAGASSGGMVNSGGERAAPGASSPSSAAQPDAADPSGCSVARPGGMGASRWVGAWAWGLLLVAGVMSRCMRQGRKLAERAGFGRRTAFQPSLVAVRYDFIALVGRARRSSETLGNPGDVPLDLPMLTWSLPDEEHTTMRG
jgi:hypothetical protein